MHSFDVISLSDPDKSLYNDLREKVSSKSVKITGAGHYPEPKKYPSRIPFIIRITPANSAGGSWKVEIENTYDNKTVLTFHGNELNKLMSTVCDAYNRIIANWTIEQLQGTFAEK